MKNESGSRPAVANFSWGLVPLFVLAHCTHHILTALPTPFLPMIRDDFHLNYTQSGLLLSAFSLSYGLGQLPAGWLADRIGQVILITMGICGVAMAGPLVGFSQTYTMAVIFLILMGLMGGGYHPAAPALISTSVKAEHLGRSLGFHIIGGSSSYFLAPLIGVAIAAALGWRGAFIGLALPTVILGVFFFFLIRRRIGGLKAIQPPGASSLQETKALPGQYRQLVVMIILSTCTAATMISTISFIPLFLVDHFGVNEKTAAALLSIIYSGGLWAAPIGGTLSDRLGKIPVLLFVCFLAGPVIFLLNFFSYGIGTWGLLLVLGICLAVRMPVMESYLVSHTTVKNRSTVLGIYYFTAMESGGVLTPAMGYLIDRFGFFPSFTIAGAALLLVTFICSLWLREKRK
ncbi:MAG: MFS transporter [Deltaproteobacteria bacterium]|nr:MFS transporter [Deltaproteobacteria bacterium]